VRVFELDGDTWTQVGADIDGPAGRGAGWAVAMSADGARVVIGGPGVSSTTGVVTVYEESDGEWSLVGAPISADVDELGHAVTISDDGNRIAFSYPSASGSSLPGSVVVDDWNGSEWELVGSVIDGEEISDGFGTSLSLSGDGNVLAIGGPGNAGTGATSGGHLRVYELDADEWVQRGEDIDGSEEGDSFGTSVSLAADGLRVIGGGPGGAGGRAYDFVGGAWTHIELDVVTASRAGTTVAISADGAVVAIGSAYYSGSAGSASGAVHAYALP
jgi:hypothetical protein